MTGQKQRSGGKRQGAGRHRQRFYLEKEAAQELFLIVQHRRMLQPHLTEEQVLADLIHKAWHEIDQGYQQAAQAVMDAEECLHVSVSSNGSTPCNHTPDPEQARRPPKGDQ